MFTINPLKKNILPWRGVWVFPGHLFACVCKFLLLKLLWIWIRLPVSSSESILIFYFPSTYADEWNNVRPSLLPESLKLHTVACEALLLPSKAIHLLRIKVNRKNNKVSFEKKKKPLQELSACLQRIGIAALRKQRGRGTQSPAFDIQSCPKLNNSLNRQSLSREEMISKFPEPLLT